MHHLEGNASPAGDDGGKEKREGERVGGTGGERGLLITERKGMGEEKGKCE